MKVQRQTAQRHAQIGEGEALGKIGIELRGVGSIASVTRYLRTFLHGDFFFFRPK